MKTTLSGTLMVGLYRLLLRLYPRRFRVAYGEEMVRLMLLRADRARTEGGRLARFRSLLSAVADLAKGAPGARRDVDSARRRAIESPGAGRRPRGELMTLGTFRDVRFAMRTMLRRPGLSATIVLTLAIGMASTISLYSIVDGALLRPLPYPEPEELVSLVHLSDQFGMHGFAPPFMPDLRARMRSYSAIAGFSSTWHSGLTEVAEPRLVGVAYVTKGLFGLLGAVPVSGRLFTPDELEEGGDPVAIVNQTFWEREFGLAPFADRRIRVADVDLTIIGILPASFRMPITGSSVSSETEVAEMWLPFARNQFARIRAAPVMNVVGRLAPGVGLAAANGELKSVNAALAADYPDAGIAPQTQVLRLSDLVTGPARATVMSLFGAAVCLLLIGCANAANLLLVQADERRREIAIRTALGASRGRVVVQLLSESLLLAALGSGAGLMVAAALLAVVPTLGLAQLPPSASFAFDLRVVAFAVALTLATAVLFGVGPALRGSRGDARAVLAAAGRGSSPGRGLLRRALVVAEVALALVLLVGAGLLARSFWRLTAVDPGFEAGEIITVQLTLPTSRYETSELRQAFFDSLAARLDSLPGVRQTSAVNRSPFSGSNVFVMVDIEGAADGADPLPMDRRVVRPGYFDAMSIPHLGGRRFGPADGADGAEPVGVVNQAAVRAAFSGENPIGRRVRMRLRGGAGPWITIVGVVGDVRHHGLEETARPELYVPYSQASVRGMAVLVRAEGDAEALQAAVKQRIWELDKDLPLDSLTTMRASIAGSVSAPRFRALILNAFAAMALTLAVVGIGGVVSHAVARRAREIGIRMALGAPPRKVLLHALREGVLLGIGGAAVGLLAALGLTRWLASMLFGITTTDPITYAAVTGLLVALTTVASYLPARRATRVAPADVLRAE